MKNYFLILVITSLAIVGCTGGKNKKMNFVIACYEGDYIKVETMINEFDTVNFRSMKGETPLTAAASRGHTNIINLLVKNGADILYRDEAGNTACDIALASGYKELCDNLKQERVNRK